MTRIELLNNLHEVIDFNPAYSIADKEYFRLLGYPNGHQPDERPLELIEEAKNWYANNGKPWIYAYRTDRLSYHDNVINIDGINFHSNRLYKTLSDAEADQVWLVAVSAGESCENYASLLWKESKPDEYFFMETLGSAVVENLVMNTGARFCQWADELEYSILPHYSPGYPEWDVSEQKQLLKLIKGKSNGKFGNLNVLDSGMLNPKKSLLAVFGVTKNIKNIKDLTQLIPCENCSLPGCNYRRVPYLDIQNTTAEEVGKMKEKMLDTLSKLNGQPENVLTSPANYKLGHRVLEKWSNERLQLTFNDDESIEAKFRFDGTTCSNLGHALVFEYSVLLSSEEEGFIIKKMTCKPSGDDTGHKSMCEYIKRHRMFLDQIAGDRPILSKPLNDVLEWNTLEKSTGCFCDPLARLHKWKMVLEVLHYSLSKRQCDD